MGPDAKVQLGLTRITFSCITDNVLFKLLQLIRGAVRDLSNVSFKPGNIESYYINSNVMKFTKTCYYAS